MEKQFKIINWKGIKPFRIKYRASIQCYTDVDEKIHHLRVGFMEFRLSVIGKGIIKSN